MRKISDNKILESLIRRYGTNTILNEIENINTEMSYKDIAKKFCELGIHKFISSNEYPEVAELVEELPDVFKVTYDYSEFPGRGVETVNFVVNKNKVIYLYIDLFKHNIFIHYHYSKSYYHGGVKENPGSGSDRIDRLGPDVTQKCLKCLRKILHRLNNENIKTGVDLSNNNDNIKLVNSNANKMIEGSHYYYEKPFYIKTCTFNEFIEKYPLELIKRSSEDRKYFDYYLDGDFNKLMNNRSGKNAPDLQLYGRYYPDTNEFYLIYDKQWDGSYNKSKVNYIPIGAYTKNNII